jgi:hypothetical protein
MREHHARAIKKLADTYRDDVRFLAMIIGGSVPKGLAVDSSDIDFMLIATDEEFAKRKEQGRYHEWAGGICDYEGGYVDGKVIDLSFLHAAAERGSEPARFAFADLIVAFSRIPGLEDLIKRIVAYPEHERADKIDAFCCNMELAIFFVDEAVKRGNRYLLLRGVTDVVLFGGRAILAHNRMLYPYHKWFMTQLARAPEKPEGIVEMAEALLREPDGGRAHAFRDRVAEFMGWKNDVEKWVDRTVVEGEWNWMEGTPPAADR